MSYLPCAKCGADVAEGSSECPVCGAGLASVVLSKERRGLTRTLIAKAVELRQSIPWARPSQVVLLNDDPLVSRTMRVAGRRAPKLLALAAAAIAGVFAWQYLRRPVVVLEVAVAPPEVRTGERGERAPPTPPAGSPAEKPAEAAAPPTAPAADDPPLAAPVAAPKATPPKAPASKPAVVKKDGTLVVVARHKGKAVKDAVVRVNGLSMGKTPMNAQVAPGSYTVKISKPGFKTEKREAVVRPSKKQTLLVELKR